jgi:transcriptional regulator with XRE-family HTH domain
MVVDAAVVIKAARRRAGLTQKELAGRSATTQSAIAAYEGGAKQPSMVTLNRLVAGAGCSIAWYLGPVKSVVHSTVEAIARSLHGDDEHEALRLAADLWTGLASLPASEVAADIEVDPGSTGDRRWDALVAGVVERAAHVARIRTPMWTASEARFLDEWWFLTPYRSLHASALVGTPAELANRGVFVHESSLGSV